MSQTSYTTAITNAYAGMIASNAEATLIESGVSTESSASMPFGSMVVYDTGRAAGDQSRKLPSASSGQNFMGLVAHSHTYARTWTDASGVVHGEVDGTGLVPKTVLNVMVKGRMWINVETATDVGDPLWIRYTTDGGSPAFTQAGAAGNATGTGRTLDLTAKGRFLTKVSAPAQGSYKLSQVEVDMTA
jgi:hypothetical protein